MRSALAPAPERTRPRHPDRRRPTAGRAPGRTEATRARGHRHAAFGRREPQRADLLRPAEVERHHVTLRRAPPSSQTRPSPTRSNAVRDRAERRGRATTGPPATAGGPALAPAGSSRGRAARCAREDLNLHPLSGTRPSTVRVCLFRHSRVAASEVARGGGSVAVAPWPRQRAAEALGAPLTTGRRAISPRSRTRCLATRTARCPPPRPARREPPRLGTTGRSRRPRRRDPAPRALPRPRP
jgi:hypothetical protein